MTLVFSVLVFILMVLIGNLLKRTETGVFVGAMLLAVPLEIARYVDRTKRGLQ